jgi:hypothetical protein
MFKDATSGLACGVEMNITIPTIAAVSVALILAPAAKADSGIFTYQEAKYMADLAAWGILPQTLGLHNGRDEVALGEGICLALDKASGSDVEAGVKRNFPNLSQLQVNEVIGTAVADFCEQNAGKLS